MPTGNWIRFNDALLREGETWLRGTYSPPASFDLILCNGTISSSGTASDVLAIELPAANGYLRQAITFSAGVYDIADTQAEFQSNTVNIAASGGDLIYNNIVIWANGAGGYPEMFLTVPLQTIFNGTSHDFSLTWTVSK